MLIDLYQREKERMRNNIKIREIIDLNELTFLREIER